MLLAPGRLGCLVAAALGTGFAVGLGAGCSDAAAIGSSCSTGDDCGSDAQCFQGVCAPRCRQSFDCGGGYRCNDGTCIEVSSEIGDECERELDCGPGQACRPEDDSPIDPLPTTCQVEMPGTVTAAACAADGDCRTGLCALGLCTEVCGRDADCPIPLTCVSLPRHTGGLYDGCMPASGAVTLSIPVVSTFSEIAVPVPGHASSFAMVASVEDPAQLVGAATVRSPSGEILYATPHSPAEYYANPIRYEPWHEISTLLVPNSPRVTIEPGLYHIDVASFRPGGGLGSAIPRIKIVYRLGTPGSVLDLHFHFLNLVDHPCSAAFDADGLNATSAVASPQFQNVYLAGLRQVLLAAGITTGEVTYSDIPARPDLDSIDIDDIGRLLQLAEGDGGVHVFFVRSLTPLGVQAFPGGTPGPPGMGGTTASGIVVSVDTLCYRGWSVLARSTAHALGRQLGLFRNREPDGSVDPIDDSDSSADNLMFFGDLGGIDLSPGQVDVLRRNPTVR